MVVTAALLAASVAFAQTAPSPTTPPSPSPGATQATPAPPPSPVSAIRYKLSAGDLLSAESILEVHREQHGEDGAWLTGLSWLARGAWLMGDVDKAHRYAEDVRSQCTARLPAGASVSQDHDVEIALGAAIEVEAQVIERQRGSGAAAEYIRHELSSWSAAPTAFQCRLYKRLDVLTLEGTPAPELVVEDRPTADAGLPVPTLAALTGQPVVLFLWAEGCGDCKAQSASLVRVLQHHRADGLRCIAVTRYYDIGEAARAAEKLRADSVWTTVYSGMGPVPRVISTASMIRYGVSSTPTFAFVDRKGVLRRYTPTRLSEPELERGVAAILK